ncbi:FMN-binding negative transcriptional regulator [Amycolatopsis sp. SID8362]|uniref:FMN-binding negative transcriptional regulator n=1 Tax=Amycolatopsis sp. SID8362 TaxID=2690346 RepID=UPI00136943B5|nr:FMN-binding negative transcriptional regulator [Amycolatopsis sp. SID8362]NBH01916.1 FMN-binding negative transcriptional regulator [Amycolatopsis sp. SID8362]NED38619.1 FMN-binding negative transcriptional regulator [Amycolatopsis sp. SID8362]
MLIHPWDAADDSEWREWLSSHDFGQLIAGGTGRDLPVVTPAHFAFDGDRTVVTHLARPNPIWPLLEEHPRALLTVVDDYTYIRADWNTTADPAHGVPTSYYATVQLEGDVRLVDDPAAKAALLDKQLRHFEPDGARAPVSATEAPDRRLLPGIRGIEFTITGVRAKFKFGGNKTAEDRERIGARLAARAGRLDAAALTQLRRRG